MVKFDQILTETCLVSRHSIVFSYSLCKDLLLLAILCTFRAPNILPHSFINPNCLFALSKVFFVLSGSFLDFKNTTIFPKKNMSKAKILGLR